MTKYRGDAWHSNKTTIHKSLQRVAVTISTKTSSNVRIEFAEIIQRGQK